nr:acyltransferase [Luteibacter rhizovicinus]
MEKDRAADGLRGMAALAVFFGHFFLAFYPAGSSHFFSGAAAPGATVGIAEKILALPFISAFLSGRFPVAIFFVLSGYVLTKGFVKDGDLNILRSLFARRYFRLGIPVFGSVVFAYVLFLAGAYPVETTASITKSAWLITQSIHGNPTVLDALRDAIYGVVLVGSAQFNTVFWTMRIEFLGSIMIFSYMALAWTDRRALFAVGIYLALIFVFAPVHWPYYAAFLVGRYIGNARVTMPPWASYGCIAFAMYLASMDASPMFAYLYLIPIEPDLLGTICSVFAGGLVLLAVRAGALRYLLTCTPALYLGRISYPLYLVHVPIVMSLGCIIFNSLYESHGRSAAVASALVASLAATFLVASVFERFVDQPAIRFGKWMTQRKVPTMGLHEA